MDRLFSSLKRSGLPFVTVTPVRIQEAPEIEPHLSAPFNCILFFSHGEGERVPPTAKMQTHWDWLNIHAQLPPTLFAGFMCRSYDPAASKQILQSSQTFAPLALAPQSSLTPREAGLFLLKFFTELHLHSAETVSGKMVWFSYSKARELLRRRRYTGKFGVRC